MATFYSPPADKTQVSVSDDGGTTFFRLQNITSVDISGGDRAETTTETLDNDAVTSVGGAQPKDISVGVNSTPGSRGYRIMAKGYDDSTRVLMRVDTPHTNVIDNSTAARTIAIAATGNVTGVQTKFASAPWEAGQALVISNVTYIIESITSDTAMTVSRADGMAITQVSATDDWELWNYGLRWQINVEVLNAKNPSFATGGAPVTETITLKSVGTLPDPSLLVTTI